MNSSNSKIHIQSVCIPRTNITIIETQVRSIFNSLNIGNIGRIDMIKKRSEKGEHYQRIFVHFNNWYSNETAIMAKERLLNGKEIKIIYDDPWFWKVSASTSCNTSCNTSCKKENVEEDDDNWRKPRKK